MEPIGQICIARDGKMLILSVCLVVPAIAKYLPTYLLDIKATLIALFTGCKTLPDTKTSKSVDHLEAKLFFAPLIETHFQMSACPV